MGICKCCNNREDEFSLGFCFDCANAETIIYSGFDMYDEEIPKQEGMSTSMSKLQHILKLYGLNNLKKNNMKEETLEEVVNNFKKTDVYINEIKQEQERMYSEEEVFSLMCKAFEAGYKKYDVVEAGLEGLETEIECNWLLKK